MDKNSAKKKNSNLNKTLPKRITLSIDFIGNSTRHVIASGFCEAISRLMGQIDLLEIASPRKERGVRKDIVIADNV